MLGYRGIPYKRIDGTMPLCKRNEALRAFQHDDEIRVILVSITCGGAGWVYLLYNLQSIFDQRLVLTSPLALGHIFSSHTGIPWLKNKPFVVSTESAKSVL